MKSPWEIMDEIARQATLMCGTTTGAAQDLAKLITAQALVLRDHIERVGMRYEQIDQAPEDPLVEGQEYELLVRVRVRVDEVHDAHGLCYQLGLETRDWAPKQRTVGIDHSEIVSATPIDRSGGRYG